MVYKLCILKLISNKYYNIILYSMQDQRGNKIMGNEKSVYELRLEEKDKIINFQQKLIVFLIKVVVLISFFGFLTIGFLGYQYFNDDFCSTNITGNNNQSTNGNTLDSSSIEEN